MQVAAQQTAGWHLREVGVPGRLVSSAGALTAAECTLLFQVYLNRQVVLNARLASRSARASVLLAASKQAGGLKSANLSLLRRRPARSMLGGRSFLAAVRANQAVVVAIVEWSCARLNTQTHTQVSGCRSGRRWKISASVSVAHHHGRLCSRHLGLMNPLVGQTFVLFVQSPSSSFSFFTN